MDDLTKLIIDVTTKLNNYNVHYYLVGAISIYINLNLSFKRKHEDLDLLVNELDLEKIKMVFKDTQYTFLDNRFSNQKTYNKEMGFTEGEHEVIVTLPDSSFHIGLFLYQENLDGSIDIREYFNDFGKTMVLIRNIPYPRVKLEYNIDGIIYHGINIKTASIENLYRKKRFHQREKDIIDVAVMQDYVDLAKVAAISQYKVAKKLEEVV